jgi:hypothetical protein
MIKYKNSKSSSLQESFALSMTQEKKAAISEIIRLKGEIHDNDKRHTRSSILARALWWTY